MKNIGLGNLFESPVSIFVELVQMCSVLFYIIVYNTREFLLEEFVILVTVGIDTVDQAARGGQICLLGWG